MSRQRVVKAGESWASIARDEYGGNGRWLVALAKANGGVGRELRPDDTLTIPDFDLSQDPLITADEWAGITGNRAPSAASVPQVPTFQPPAQPTAQPTISTAPRPVWGTVRPGSPLWNAARSGTAADVPVPSVGQLALEFFTRPFIQSRYDQAAYNLTVDYLRYPFHLFDGNYIARAREKYRRAMQP